MSIWHANFEPVRTWFGCELVSREINPVDTFPPPYKHIRKCRASPKSGEDASPDEVRYTQKNGTVLYRSGIFDYGTCQSGPSSGMSSIRFDIHRFHVSHPIWCPIQQMLWMLVIALGARIGRAAGGVT